jgi:hypothetical protein
VGRRWAIGDRLFEIVFGVRFRLLHVRLRKLEPPFISRQLPAVTSVAERSYISGALDGISPELLIE